MNETTAQAPPAMEHNETRKARHGTLYWGFANTVRLVRQWAIKHQQTARRVIATVAILLFVLRTEVQWIAIALRVYAFDIFIVMTLVEISVFALWWTNRHKCKIKEYKRAQKTDEASADALPPPIISWRQWLVILAIATGVACMFFVSHDYVTLYLRYQSLNVQYLNHMPETAHERIQPLQSIAIMAQKKIQGNQEVTKPVLVRLGNAFRWTSSIEPGFLLGQLLHNVNQILDVSSTDAMPDFSEDSFIPVNFATGEHLLAGRNVMGCAIRSLPPWRYFSYYPSEMRYLRNTIGDYVQVVSFVKKDGYIYPQDTFGGLQVIEQLPKDASIMYRIFHYIKVILIGDGQWIPPEDIGKYPYLKGQNIVPELVTRTIARSFRFRRGFFAPIQGNHEGDVRIPNLPGDANDQPFATFFHSDEVDGEIYDYFAIQPYKEENDGLVLSVLVPDDGIGTIKVRDHEAHHERFMGVTAVTGLVRGSIKNYDWANSLPTEHRPYVRNIDGVTRFFWETTLATNQSNAKGEEARYAAGSTPEVALTDATYGKVVQVDAAHCEIWSAQLKHDLSAVWKSNAH